MDDELLNDFIEESVDLIEKVKVALLHWDNTEDKVEAINSIYRWVHTIKGGCGIFNYTTTATLAHTLETYLGELRKDALKVSSSHIDHIHQEIEKIENSFFSQKETSSPVEVRKETSFDFETNYFKPYVEDNLELLSDLIKDGFSFFELILPKDLSDKLIEKLKEHGFSPIDSYEREEGLATLCFVKLETDSKNIQSIENLVTHYQGQWCSPKPGEEKKEAPKVESRVGSSGPVQTQEVLRVPLETINSILDHVWELFLVRNQMNHLFKENKNFLKDNHAFVQQFESLDNLLERNIHELESKTMSMRLSPIKKVFDRLEKVVEEYCQKSSKKIEFNIGGAGIDLDKKVLDQLNEPLIHLIRNAIDHGVEDASSRIQKGKSSNGNVSLSASLQGNEVHIFVKDDGKGIDANKILESAKKKGLATEHLKTEQEILELIFASGFSTAEEVTDVSGRGVGMDAVRKSIQELGGSVSLETKVGSGTTFKITLPLTMSVSKCLIVEVKGLEYGISTKSVQSIEKISPHILKKNGVDEYYEFHGDLLPCYSLDVSEKDFRREPDLPISNIHVCVTKVQDKLVAFKVDNILQTLNVVIKPLPTLMEKHPYLSGVSILPAGNPIFILNVYENLLRNIQERSGAKNVKRTA